MSQTTTSPTNCALADFAPELLAAARTLVCPAGAALFHAGEKPQWMYYVVDGEACLSRTTPEGTDVLLQRARRSFLAEASLTAAQYHCDARCRSACALQAFPAKLLRHHIDTHAPTRWAWINLLSQETRRQRARIERLSLKTVRERLLHLLAAESTNGRYTLAGPRTELAAELGVTPEALYRTLATLQRDGVLTVGDGALLWHQDRGHGRR